MSQQPQYVDLDAAFAAWWQQVCTTVGDALRRDIPRWGDASYPWDLVDPAEGPPRSNWRGNLVAAAVTALAILMTAGAARLVWFLALKAVHLGGDGLAHAARWPLMRVVLDPVQAYLQAHTAGLPASAGTLYTLWLWSIVVLIALASVGSVGARIGWVLLGLMSTAMVWIQTPAAGQWIAGGVTVLWWSVLSVPALARYRRFEWPVTLPSDTAAPPPTQAP